MAENEAQQKPAKGGAGKIVALVVVLIAAGAGWWFVHQRHSTSQPPPDPEPSVVVVLHLENFIVNLADPQQNSFLRIGVDLGLSHPLPKEGKTEAPNPTPLIRDTIISVLSSATTEDMLKPEGKTKLKEQLTKSIQARAPELGLQEIYFTEFLVQR